MLKNTLKNEIKKFVGLISKKEIETNEELNAKIFNLSNLFGEYIPTREFTELDLPAFISYDLLVAKGRG